MAEKKAFSMYGSDALQTTDKTLVGGINEVNGSVTTLKSDVTTLKSDVSTLKSNVTTLQNNVSTLQSNVTSLTNNKQNKTDNSLTTTSKTIVGGINELKTSIDFLLGKDLDPNKEYQLYYEGGKVLWKEIFRPWYEYENWWNYCSNGVQGSQASETDIGKEVNLTVNGQVHKVRLIGIDHDDLATGGKAHCTFEFVNFISDGNGYSLATYWKNTADTSNANFDFLNSSIRKALTGQGSGDCHWFQKDSKTWSTTYTGSVLSMLPTDLQNAIKSVKKKVNLKTTGSWVETDFTDKLFLLAPKEVGYSASYMETGVTTYKFYEGHTEQTDAIRIKAQVKGSGGARTSSLSGTDLDGAYTSTKYSYAGYHNGSGGDGWLRSPYTNSAHSAWLVGNVGNVNSYYVCNCAFAVAPAFCI